MASLALGVAGAYVGSFFGPFGASVGWMLGSALGTALDPQKIKGPTLSDLKVQGSEYGTPIPIVYGTVRIAGCSVLWKSDLIPHEHTSGGKGGGPETTTTTYSCTFAIQICEGPIAVIPRIWADSRLVHENGEGLEFVLYLGTEDQMPDPSGEALLGVGNVPAHRGYAYVSFTDLDLTDFGNRIPNFTFEVATVGSATGSIRRLEQQYESGIDGSIFANGFTPSNNNPVITHWPWQGGTIRVRTGGRPQYEAAPAYYEFDRATLTLADGTNHDDFPTSFRLHNLPACPVNAWDFYQIGVYVYADDETTVNLWAVPFFPVGLTNIGPAIYDGAITQPDCGPPHSARNFLYLAGVPSGEYLGAAVLSENGKRLFAFTAPTATTPGSAIIDKWYEIIDGELARQGTVDPALTIQDLGFSNGNTYGFQSSMFENNGTYCWTFYGAAGDFVGPYGSGGVVRYWAIDQAGNFAMAPYPGTYHFENDTVGGTRAVNETVPIEGQIYGSIRVIKTGYAGIVGSDNLAVFTRFTEESDDLLLMDIVADLSERAGLDPGEIDVSELTDVVHGYVIADQAEVRAALAPLQTGYFFDCVESGSLIKFPKRGQEPIVTIPDDELAAHEDKAESPPLLTFTRAQEVDLPRRIFTTYFDQNAAYQTGTQMAQRMVTSSRLEMAVTLPIALDAAEAKQIADRLLWSAWYERDSFTFHTSRKYGYLEPTDSVIAHGRSLRITTREEQAGGVIKWQGVQTIGAVFIPGGGATGESGSDGSGNADGGIDGVGNVPPPIVLPQTTDLLLLDIPYIADPARQAVYWAAMAGTERPEWKGASLQKSVDGGVNYAQIGTSTSRDAMGTASTTLGDFDGGNVFDCLNRLTVVMTDGAQELSSSTRTGVLNGANRAMIGDEMISYLNAELTAPLTYDLSGFLRGRNGTEWAIGAHAADETFVALPVSVELAAVYAEYNTIRQYKAVTFGNTLAGTSSQEFTNTGRSLKCFAPALLGGGRNAAGDILLQWTRRARVNNTWLDGIDVPLGETEEKYSIRIYSDGTYTTILDHSLSTVPSLTFDVGQQTVVFGSPQSTLYWGVLQYGALGLGYEARAIT